jgi:ubiquitin C-terminal hydrolase
VWFREHVSDVAKMLTSVSRLLATPAAHEIVELCELRNLLLIGVMPHQFKFINTKQLSPGQYLNAHLSAEGFFSDYGCPTVAYMGSKMLTFWPDEWQRAVGGIKAVGHFVEWYHTGGFGSLALAEAGSVPTGLDASAKSSIQSAGTGEEAAADEPAPTWLVGRVVGYLRHTGEHLVRLESGSVPSAIPNGFESAVEASNGDAPPASRGHSDSSPGSSPVPISVVCKVNLAAVKHNWVDAQFRGRISMHSHSGEAGSSLGDPLLEHANTDVGHFIRIWWSRYSKYYYGRVVRYDPVNRSHAVTYEDGETRTYDMTVKDYELIVPPESLLRTLTEMSDVEASKEVANWHRSLSDQGVPPVAPADGAAAPLQFSWLTRPTAATALSVSLYQLAVIDEYFREGGADSVFQSLTDASQAAPISRLILLHLQLALHLRPVVGQDRFKDLVWELKEGVPSALFRYEDAQFKELSAKNLNDILGTLKDLLLVVVSGSQYVVNDGVRDSVDEIRLTLGSALLVCSQLQKRYLGLSMIRESLETILPRLDGYLARRYTAIGVPRAAKGVTRPASHTSSAGKITTAFMDKWLVEHEVLETIFGESLHQDLASKSDAILVYMASRKILTEKHIDLIWGASLGVHEAVVRVIHQLLILIVPTLGPHLRNYLFSLMSALPCKDYTEQILQLIKTFTVQAIIASKDDDKNVNSGNGSGAGTGVTLSGAPDAGAGKKGQVTVAPPRQWMGFTVLWQFVQDPAAPAGEGVDEGLVDVAVQLLVELLQEEFKEDRELVMQRCLDNIQAGRSVPVSMQLLRRTLALYPAAPKSWFVLNRPSGPKVVTVGQQIEKLIKNSQLLDILFRDLEAYHKTVTAAEKADAPGMPRSLSGANFAKSLVKKVRTQTVAVQPSTFPPQLQIQTTTTAKGTPAAPSGRVSLLKGVSERLDFLRFIISCSTVKLTEAQTMLLWNAFGEGASTAEALEKLVIWFNALINKENKALSALLSSLAQESDPTEPDQRSRLTFLSPQVLAISQLRGDYSFSISAAAAQALTSSAAESDGNSTGGAGGSAAVAGATAPSANGAAADAHATFEEGVLVKLFEEHVLKWAYQYDKVEALSRFLVANLCFKLFLHTNICNRGIKVDADGSWVRVGPLVGLPLLWRIALDATDAQVAQAAIALLIELHHKTAVSKMAKPTEGHKAHLLRMCFLHLYLAMQSLQLDESAQAATGEYSMPPLPPPAVRQDSATSASNRPLALTNKKAGAAGDPTTHEDMFHDNDALMRPGVIASRIERLIIALRLAIHRFYMAPEALCSIKVLVGREEAPVFTVVLKATDTVGQLRMKIAEHFKENVTSIQMHRITKSSSLIGMGSENKEILDKDEVTLTQAKLAQQDSVTAQKKDSATGEIGVAPGSIQVQKPVKASEVKDVFSTQDLTTNLLKPLNPLRWICTDAPLTGQVPAGATQTCSVDRGYELFVFPPFPLVAVIETKLAAHDEPAAEETVIPSQKTGAAQVRESPVSFTSGVSTAVSERRAKVLEFLTPIVKSAPHYVDQLLEVLDGYLAAEHTGAEGGTQGTADLSAAVWDILLSLPTHVQLSQQLRDVVNAPSGSTAELSRLLSPTCPYRLLYSLKVLESFLRPGAALTTTSVGKASSQAGGADWKVKFFHIGGAEFILQLLETFLAKELAREAHPLTIPLSGGAAVKQEGMPRKDVGVMIIALLSRLLYHLLMADPLFNGWQSQNVALNGSAGEAPVLQADSIPPGIILSGVDVAGLTQKAFKCFLHAASLFKSSLLTETALKALCENLLLLVFALLKSVDNGVQLLSDHVEFTALVTALCVKCSSAAVRQAACRRLFEAEASIFHKCADPNVAQDEKRGRLKLYDYLYQVIVTAVDASASGVTPDASGHYVERVRYGEQIYTLLAAVETLRNSPYLIFPQISSPKVMRSSSSASSIWAKSHESPPDSPLDFAANPSQHSVGDPAHQQAMLRLFVTKLVHHTSTESFHSARADGTLVGLLRVLLVFANSSDERRTALGRIEVAVEEERGASNNVRLISFLYNTCLFPSLLPASPAEDASPVPGRAAPFREADGPVEAVCQTNMTRRLAYALLYRLCESNPENLAQLVDTLGSDIETTVPAPTTTQSEGAADAVDSAMRRLPVWNYDPSNLVKEPDAYVGLCNQGGTCYMNSFVQQLFHIPAFKSGLLRINAAKKRAEKAPVDASAQPDANAQLLFQLQVMFGFMNFSQKRYYDTLPFCRTFLDYDGEPVSLSEQKDINEFAGMLFDKLEHNKEANALLASTIQGRIVYRTRSIETPYRSEREETFYMLTAEVKDKASLEDSLELFTADELFQGDNKIEDADTGRKVDALRGCAIRTLPSTLIIHLKRFEFDLETMNRKKVNDYISFPMELNMFPYTEEGVQAKEDKLRAAGGGSVSPVVLGDAAPGHESPELGAEESATTPRVNPVDTAPKKDKRPDSYYRYSLKGIVAHVGAIDRGHYYSFIKDKEKGTGEWLEFNDRSVLPFSPDAIPTECFGGKEEYVNSNGVTTTRVRENNAYLLVYERCTAEEEAAAAQAREEPSRSRGGSENVEDALSLMHGRRMTRSNSIDDSTPRGRGVSRQVMRAVSTENAEFQRDRFLFNPLHFAFAWQIQQMQSVTRLLENVKSIFDGSHKYVYEAAEADSPKLSLEPPSAGSSKKIQSAVTLSRLALVSARFIVEVLVRAKAQACVHQFIERLEEIVMQDTTGACALALLEQFGSEGTLKTAQTDSDSDGGAAGAGGPVVHRSKSRLQSDLEQIEQSCHPWLAQILIYCPHAQSCKAFLRMLLTCIKVTIAVHSAGAKNAASIDNTERVRAAAAVKRLVERVLMAAERPQLDYLGVKEGFELKCAFLHQFAGLSIDEKVLLVQLGTIPRYSSAMPYRYRVLTSHLPFAFCRLCRSLVAVFSPTALKNGDAGLHFCTGTS